MVISWSNDGYDQVTKDDDINLPPTRNYAVRHQKVEEKKEKMLLQV